MFQISGSVSVGDLINLLILVTAVVGAILVIMQIRSSNKTQRTVFLKDLYSTLYSDPEMRQAFYEIEYERFKYDDAFHDSPAEGRIDRFLGFLDMVCYLHSQGFLSLAEMEFFRYEMLRTYQNPEVRRYMAFLQQWFDQTAILDKPYESLWDYCGSVNAP
jgi:hypothetical protein